MKCCSYGKNPNLLIYKPEHVEINQLSNSKTLCFLNRFNNSTIRLYGKTKKNALKYLH